MLQALFICCLAVCVMRPCFLEQLTRKGHIVTAQIRMRPSTVAGTCGHGPLLVDDTTPWPRCCYFIKGMGRCCVLGSPGLQHISICF